MKDRAWMVLAFFGFVILVVVVTFNYDKGQDQKVYDIDAMYVPDTRSDLTSSKSLYEQLQGSRSVQCPKVALEKSVDPIVTLSSVWGSYYNHPYRLSNMFITGEVLNVTESPSADNWEKVLHINDGTNFSVAAYADDEAKIKDLFTTDIFSSGGCIELVSPFSFSFGNINQGSVTVEKDSEGRELSASQKIVIVNSTGTCRITFDNVANWFCAGDEGTETVGGTGSNSKVPWESHYLKHHSVIGATSNAIVTGGSSGYVIGYAKEDTTILIEVYDSGVWKKCSLADFILPD